MAAISHLLFQMGGGGGGGGGGGEYQKALTSPLSFCILLATEVVSKIFLNLNIVACLVVPSGWGSCSLRLAIFFTHGVHCPDGCLGGQVGKSYVRAVSWKL